MDEGLLIDWVALGLRPYERRVLGYCLSARKVMSNGYFLPTRRLVSAALRLVDLGYLTRIAGGQGGLGSNWVVVTVTDGNIAVMRRKVVV